AIERFLQIAVLTKTMPPILNADQGDISAVLFNSNTFISEQPVAHRSVMPRKPFQVGLFRLAIAPRDIVAVIMIPIHRISSARICDARKGLHLVLSIPSPLVDHIGGKHKQIRLLRQDQIYRPSNGLAPSQASRTNI